MSNSIQHLLHPTALVAFIALTGWTSLAFADASSTLEDSAQSVDGAVDEAQERTDAALRLHDTEQLVERAHRAASLQADVEPGTQDSHLRTLQRSSPSTDPASLERIRTYFDLLSNEADDDAQPPRPLVRLRQVGQHLSESHDGYLPLRPYVPHPEWRDAMEMVEDGDCDDALELATELLGPPGVHANGEPGVAYGFARMQLCSDDDSTRRQGRETMDDLAQLDDTIADLARIALNRAPQLDTSDDAVGINGFIRRAQEVADEQGLEDALTMLRDFRQDLSGGWDRHRIRFAEAELLEEAGQEERAAMAYRAIFRKTSSWQSSGRIASRIEDAEQRLGRDIITFGDRVDRMRALIARGRFTMAHQVSRSNVDHRGASGSEVVGWTRYRQALQNERNRNRERAVAQFREADNLIEDPEVRPRMYFGWARALRRTGDHEKAIELYHRICEDYPRQQLCPQGLYEAARLHQYQNRHDDARELFEYVVSYHPFHDTVPDALWRYSLSAYLQDDFESALPPLRQIVDHHGDHQDESELTTGLRARYWIGVNHLQLGELDDAHQWLQSTINHGPLTWYGQLAVSRLDQAGLQADIPRPTAQLNQQGIADFSTLRIPHHPRLIHAAELTRVGLYKEALEQVRNHESVHPAPERIVPFRAALHMALDEPNWTHWIMKSEIHERGPTHRSLRDWGFAFPLNYFDLSHTYGEKFDVSPFLVQAIMRQESGFRPTVRSPAGAMGLMQLMPGTARYTERTFFDQTSITERQILDEETNVRLGTMYIRIHIAHAADHIPIALAGYNAGPAPMRSWMERFDDRDIDAWVESITYAETRGYVRKVMTSFITYQGLYGDGDFPLIELELPDELRSWGELPEADDFQDADPSDPISMLFQGDSHL